MIVDFDGRILAQADPGPGEKIVVAEIDVGALRAARAERRGHNHLAHIRTEAYGARSRSIYPPGLHAGCEASEWSWEAKDNERAFRVARERSGPDATPRSEHPGEAPHRDV